MINQGCWVAAVTPMLADGSIDYNAWELLLQRFVKAEVAGVVVLGTTGESINITTSEREQLLTIAAKVLEQSQWLIGIGHASMAQALEQAIQAKNYQPTGIMVVTPFYNRPMSAGLIKYYELILETAKLPMIAYNVPSRTGLDAGTEVWDALLKYENFCGIKEAHSDLNRAYYYKQRYPNLLILSGNDSNIPAWMQLGGDGVISVIANAEPKAVKDLCAGGHYSQDLLSLLAAAESAVNPIAIKCILNNMGLIKLGIRLPLAITDEIYNNVINLLQGEKTC